MLQAMKGLVACLEHLDLTPASAAYSNLPMSHLLLGVYEAVALVWLKLEDGADLSVFDWAGVGVALLGISLLVFGWSVKG